MDHILQTIQGSLRYHQPHWLVWMFSHLAANAYFTTARRLDNLYDFPPHLFWEDYAARMTILLDRRG